MAKIRFSTRITGREFAADGYAVTQGQPLGSLFRKSRIGGIFDRAEAVVQPLGARLPATRWPLAQTLNCRTLATTRCETRAIEETNSMRIEEVHSVILGAGPAGLAAGYTLAKAGHPPAVIEKGKVAGGLMRSIKRGDFVVDIGRKELYNRLPKVDEFWEDLLGADYGVYPHRGGVLFDGRIIEISSSFRGFRRGLPWTTLTGCAWDLVAGRVRSSGSKAHNLEEYFYQRRGRRLLPEFIRKAFKRSCPA